MNYSVSKKRQQLKEAQKRITFTYPELHATPLPKGCDEPGCDEEAIRSGLCLEHYRVRIDEIVPDHGS